jgi:hypothetical protein
MLLSFESTPSTAADAEVIMRWLNRRGSALNEPEDIRIGAIAIEIGGADRSGKLSGRARSLEPPRTDP